MSTKISQLTSATDITASDLMQIVDVEDGVMAPSGTNKKVTAQLLAKELAKQPLEPGIVISGSSSGNAVLITQTGSGNALVVEDSTNPDSSPFVIDTAGVVVAGATAASVPVSGGALLQTNGMGNGGATIGAFQWSASAGAALGGQLALVRSKSGTVGTQAAVVSGDTLGSVFFEGSDGASFLRAAAIQAQVDNTLGTNDMPGRLVFSTTADGASTPTERMRITSAGNVGISTTTPSSKLHVAGDLTMSSATVATSATAGTNGDVPAQVAGYLVVSINGTARKIPYYA
jgi:hypothetical protein